MTQETGETRDAIMEKDEKLIQDILDANKARRNKYWIVLFAKPSKVQIDGLPTLHKYIKAYDVKPNAQVGMCVAEVDNEKGTIEWEVNMPQKPFDFEALSDVGAKIEDRVVVETTNIPNAYVTK